MTMTPVRGRSGYLTWKCDVCGRYFRWDENESEWFGKWRDMDNGNWPKLDVICSAECKMQHQSNGKES